MTFPVANLVNYWKCDDGSGTNIDDSIGGQDLTIQNPTGSDFVTSKDTEFNTALFCDAPSTAATGTNTAFPLGDNPKTVIVTFKCNTSMDSQVVFSHGTRASKQLFGMAPYLYSTKWWFFTWAFDAAGITHEVPVNDKWYMWAISYAGSGSWTSYLNGEVKTGSLGGAINTTGTGSVIGNQAGGALDSSCHAPVDDVAVFNKALSTAELNEIYAAWDAGNPISYLLSTSPVITEDALSRGVVGSHYSDTVTITGNPDPTVDVTGLPATYSYSYTSPTLTITGDPIQPSTQDITIEATNTAGTATWTTNLSVDVAIPKGLMMANKNMADVARNMALVFRSETDPDYLAKTGDIWVAGTNAVKLRNFQDTGWITVT